MLRKGIMMFLLGIAAATAFAAEPPDAAYMQSAPGVEYPLTDARHRATFALGGNYEFYSAQGTEVAPPFNKEFSLGAFGAWNIVPKFSAVGSIAYGVDNQFVRTAFGASYTVIPGPVALGVGMQYEWFGKAGDTVPPQPQKEFAIGLRGGYPLNNWLVAAGSSFYAADTKQIRSALGLRAVLYKPKV
jgi:hypothetical protein